MAKAPMSRSGPRFPILLPLLLWPIACGPQRSEGPGSPILLSTVSNRPEFVSGGEVLVRMELPPALGHQDIVVTLNESDVTAAFATEAQGRSLLGLVTGLRQGENRLVARPSPEDGVPAAEIVIMNHPITGPILSGPHVEPFICQTEQFRLPDASSLGAPIDRHCSVETRVLHLYRSSEDGELHPLPAGSPLPLDVAVTTTLTGESVPFIVRLETGTMNRGIYQNVILHDPTAEPEPGPLAPPRGWNRRLIALHGSGCTGGWYVQGAAQGAEILDLQRLGEGYALFINSLNHPSNSCNPVVAGETTMMGKEHFIETFGIPDLTVSTGCSGGAYTSLQVADAFPGLFDGVHISCTYPDALAIALSGLDSRLLTNYYLNGNPGQFSEDQIVSVSGHKDARAWYDLALQAGRTDPVPGRIEPIPASPRGGPYRSAVWNPDVPPELRYHPIEHPTGARPTVFDWARNVYGIDAETGFARRPYDNVGVQYGLATLESGIITAEQFLDLNERIGGYDADANYITDRTVGDVEAIERAYRYGVTLGGGGGLAEIPVFNWSNIYDEGNFYHYQWFHFAVRERMRLANGHTENHVMWRGGPPISDRGGAINEVAAPQSWNTFIEWVAAYRGDPSSLPRREKVLLHKPALAVDACYSAGPERELSPEPQTFGREPDSRCNEVWPSYGFPRLMAGGPLHANTLKCQLKPLDRSDYPVPFSDTQWERLRSVFPTGVCDWSLPGVGARTVETWFSLGPASAPPRP